MNGHSMGVLWGSHRVIYMRFGKCLCGSYWVIYIRFGKCMGTIEGHSGSIT